MSLASRLTRCPRPFDPDRGAEMRGLFQDQAPELRDLFAGTAGCSSYLRRSMESEAEWLRDAVAVAPEHAFEALLRDAADLDQGELRAGLREVKRRVALLIALADLGGAWSLADVTTALTRFADLALQRAVVAEVGVELRRGRLPGLGEEAVAEAGGLAMLAMGKMGAFELNYSSDIDLICLFDEGRFDPADTAEARSAFVRATRRACALLSETDAEGYVFRTDLRLRPDPSVTPVCLSMAGAERYYESLGRSWERAAHIKARPAAGDLAAGEAYLQKLRPFVWRRHLDFAAIQDAHDIRLRIRQHKARPGQSGLDGYDLKQNRGGIRDIEFFTQTRQLIAGGRDPSLRVRGTVEGLARLFGAGWISEEVADRLTEDYRAHREIEHRLQMIADAQTHSLPEGDEGFARLAAFMDLAPEKLRRDINERLDRVAELTEGFFSPSRPRAREGEMPELTSAQSEMVTRWRGYPALRSERALDIFDRIKPDLLGQLLGGARPDQALASFDGFLRGLPAGVQLFSLFEANPQLTRLITDIADTAPELAQYLSGNAGVLDAVLAGSFFADWPGEDGLTDRLSRRLTGIDDYERRLDEARRWAKDWHFRIGVHHLRGLIDGVRASEQYCDLARSVLRALWPAVVENFADKHGDPPGLGAMVLGMGSVGAGRLTATSDLDLIVIYEPLEDDSSTGRKPLSTRAYYARLTQALVTALSAPTAAGRLYEVDMRLRPSGKQGPVAASFASFAAYHRTEAWTWEHLALTRACPITGPEGLCEAVDEVRGEVLDRTPDAAAVLQELASMRDRLGRAKPGGAWDAKAGPGRMQQIELVAAALALICGSRERGVAAQLAAGRTAGLIGADAERDLEQAHGLFARLQLTLRLLSGSSLDIAGLGAGGEAMLLRETGAADLQDLERRLADAADTAERRIADLIDRVVQDEAGR